MNIPRTLERREKPRVKVHFPLIAKGITTSGEKFQEEGYLDNISATGLYFWIDKLLQVGDEVHLTIQLPYHTSGVIFRSNCLTTSGKVVRAELSPEDANPKNCGIAVSFDHYRFI